MVDMVDRSTFSLSGGLMVRPNQRFAFEDGKLVVEVDAAAGCGGDGPGGAPCSGPGGASAFYEIDITPAETEGPYTVDALYGYGTFAFTGALGCRLEIGNVVCAMYDDSGRVTGGQCPQPATYPCRDNGGRPGRVWETQGVGTPRTAPSVVGGYPGYAIPGTNLHGSDVFRVCPAGLSPVGMPDTYCRDRFRFEFTRDALAIFVNGYPWYRIDGLYAVNPETGADNRIPSSWLDGVYVYFTSWKNGTSHDVLRWHWDRIAINDGSPLSSAPSFCLDQPLHTCVNMPMPSPTPSPSPSPTLSPTPIPSPNPTPSPSPTPSPTVLCEAMVRLNGQVGWAPQPPAFCSGFHP